MSGKIIFETESPITQEPESVEALAKYLNRPIENGVLDLGKVKLVKSNKGDAYYTTSATACSCPSHHWRGGRCKHMRKFYPVEETLKASIIDTGSIKPKGKWAGGHNGPVPVEMV